MMSATAVFNLMSLACARSGHYKVVTDMFERSLRFCPKVSSLPIRSPFAVAYSLFSKTNTSWNFLTRKIMFGVPWH